MPVTVVTTHISEIETMETAPNPTGQRLMKRHNGDVWTLENPLSPSQPHMRPIMRARSRALDVLTLVSVGGPRVRICCPSWLVPQRVPGSEASKILVVVVRLQLYPSNYACAMRLTGELPAALIRSR
ncbi:hypothetical protein LZ554_000538 [Drepanopeziza brunnea f. sp. 'monogermtubi']|nr:hypothetical protein LZ554_000538 [Drepanopeziza brunnea f. sp. 'monogermtubi']